MEKKFFLGWSNWEFFVWNGEKNILFGIWNGAEFQPQNRQIESPARYVLERWKNKFNKNAVSGSIHCILKLRGLLIVL